MGALDNLKWSYGETFEQLFGSWRGDLNNNFQKEKEDLLRIVLAVFK